MGNLGFTRSLHDPCLYYKPHQGLYVFVCVDDCNIFGKKNSIIDFKKEIGKVYTIKDIGTASNILSVNISGDLTTTMLDQTKYIENMLLVFRLSGAKGVDIPLPSSTKTYRDSDNPFQPTLYRRATGSLLHIANNTRPDIAFSMSHLCRKNEFPIKKDWVDVKHLWRYLQQTKDVKMIYQVDNLRLDEILVYVDSDWAGDKSDRKSTTGFVILLAGAPISWKSRKQRSLTLSTVEAEYMALSEVVREEVWLTYLLEELRFEKNR